jgi:hypothetical protein
MRDQFGNYGWIGFAALCGVFMRAARWAKPDGRFDWRKAMFECMAAPGIGLIAGGVIAMWWPLAEPPVVGMIAGALGLLGPAGIEALMTRYLDKKTGGA